MKVLVILAPNAARNAEVKSFSSISRTSISASAAATAVLRRKLGIFSAYSSTIFCIAAARSTLPPPITARRIG